MDFEALREWLTLENILEIMQQYRSLGPIAGIVLPLLEAFLPFLPLFIFVMANATAFGLWWGFFIFLAWGGHRCFSCFSSCSEIWTSKVFSFFART